MRYRETPTERKFMDSMKQERALNRSTVKAVMEAWREYVEDCLFKGEKVYFSFGTLEIVENKYGSAAIIGARGRGHKHKYRPRMRFNQAFCQEIDTRESEIESNWDGKESR